MDLAPKSERKAFLWAGGRQARPGDKLGRSVRSVGAQQETLVIKFAGRVE